MSIMEIAKESNLNFNALISSIFMCTSFSFEDHQPPVLISIYLSVLFTFGGILLEEGHDIVLPPSDIRFTLVRESHIWIKIAVIQLQSSNFVHFQVSIEHPGKDATKVPTNDAYKSDKISPKMKGPKVAHITATGQISQEHYKNTTTQHRKQMSTDTMHLHSVVLSILPERPDVKRG